MYHREQKKEIFLGRKNNKCLETNRSKPPSYELLATITTTLTGFNIIRLLDFIRMRHRVRFDELSRAPLAQTMAPVAYNTRDR